MADEMRQMAAGAVKAHLGPDPSMKNKVDLLKRLVKMREDMRKAGPIARINPPKAGPRPERGYPGVPTHLPKRPLPFTQDPNYNFGPPGDR